MIASEPKQKLVFDYRALRLTVGVVAFGLPIVTWLISSASISSISASYHTGARDIFVGSIFVIGALFFAYNGHTPPEKWVSKGAAFAAIIVAIFPTTCKLCEPDTNSVIHYVAAVILFSIIAYFCLGPFRKNTKGQKGKKGRRAIIYLVCGLIILGSMLVIGAAQLIIPEATRKTLAITFVGELVALWAFGVAWIVAGKVFAPLVDQEDRLILSLK